MASLEEKLARQRERFLANINKELTHLTTGATPLLLEVDRVHMELMFAFIYDRDPTICLPSYPMFPATCAVSAAAGHMDARVFCSRATNTTDHPFDTMPALDLYKQVQGTGTATAEVFIISTHGRVTKVAEPLAVPNTVLLTLANIGAYANIPPSTIFKDLMGAHLIGFLAYVRLQRLYDMQSISENARLFLKQVLFSFTGLQTIEKLHAMDRSQFTEDERFGIFRLDDSTKKIEKDAELMGQLCDRLSPGAKSTNRTTTEVITALAALRPLAADKVRIIMTISCSVIKNIKEIKGPHVEEFKKIFTVGGRLNRSSHSFNRASTSIIKRASLSLGGTFFTYPEEGHPNYFSVSKLKRLRTMMNSDGAGDGGGGASAVAVAVAVAAAATEAIVEEAVAGPRANGGAGTGGGTGGARGGNRKAKTRKRK